VSATTSAMDRAVTAAGPFYALRG